jgi:hypothetical protein
VKPGNPRKPGTDETFPCIRESFSRFGALNCFHAEIEACGCVRRPASRHQRGNSRQDVFLSDGLRHVYLEPFAEHVGQNRLGELGTWW